MNFHLFKKETRDDPQFGLLTKKSGVWIGKLPTHLFPGIDLTISVKAKGEDQLAVSRKHLEQVLANADTIRSQIASEALATFRIYEEEEGETEPYPKITSADDIWPLIHPQAWRFAPDSIDFKSSVVINFGWPNPHYLVAYVNDTELYQLAVEG